MDNNRVCKQNVNQVKKENFFWVERQWRERRGGFLRGKRFRSSRKVQWEKKRRHRTKTSTLLLLFPPRCALHVEWRRLTGFCHLLPSFSYLGVNVSTSGCFNPPGENHLCGDICELVTGIACYFPSLHCPPPGSSSSSNKRKKNSFFYFFFWEIFLFLSKGVSRHTTYLSREISSFRFLHCF